MVVPTVGSLTLANCRHPASLPTSAREESAQASNTERDSAPSTNRRRQVWQDQGPLTVTLRFVRIDAIFRPNDRRNGGTGNEQVSDECRQDGADRRHVGADRAHAAGQGDRPRRHGGGQPPFRGRVALAVPHRIAVARPSGAVRQLEQRLGAVPPLDAFRGFERVFNTLSEEFDLECVFVDGTVVQAHQKASGARGGPKGRGSAAPGAA